jgi:hypothetical protein
LGIDVLLMGTIKHTYNSNRTTGKTTDGATVYTTENTCATEIFIKIVSVENAQIIATKTIKRVSSDKKWGSNENTVLGFEPLAEKTMKALAFDAACFFAPFYAHSVADFRKIKVKEYKDKASDIKGYIENADFNNLYSIYKAIYDADNYNADAAYNLALIYYITGDYVAASNWAKIANEADPKEYEKEKEWASLLEVRAKSLNDLGLEISKYDFNAKLNSDVLADKIKTKGTRSDRFEVFEKSDKSSTIVTKVPGDAEFVVVEQAGGFVKIKLLGGKEGFISIENIKK